MCGECLSGFEIGIILATFSAFTLHADIETRQTSRTHGVTNVPTRGMGTRATCTNTIYIC